MNISKEHFSKLAQEHLTAFEGYTRDENGNFLLEIGGVENLYDAIKEKDCSFDKKISSFDEIMSIVQGKMSDLFSKN